MGQKSFDGKDTHTINKLVSIFSGLNINEEDKMSLTIRDNGVPIASFCCNRMELEKFCWLLKDKSSLLAGRDFIYM